MNSLSESFVLWSSRTDPEPQMREIAHRFAEDIAPPSSSTRCCEDIAPRLLARSSSSPLPPLLRGHAGATAGSFFFPTAGSCFFPIPTDAAGLFARASSSPLPPLRRILAGALPDSYSEPPPEQASAPHQTSIAISLARCKASDFSDQRLIAKWSDPAAPLPRPPPRDRVDLAAPPPRPSTLSPSAMSPQQAPLLCSPPGPLTARSQSTPPSSLPRPTPRLPDHHLLQHHIVALDFCLIAVTETFINPRWPWYHDAAVTTDTIPSWKLSNSTRQSSCRDGEKYGEAAVKLLAATLGDQWVLADKRMHINNNWWRRIRRLVKSASCNY
uniref:Uncharacterized protein n=2 Tax=Oryza glumipatula TaxID=40148 RepID=A0A0E0APE6_9ORYZ